MAKNPLPFWLLDGMGMKDVWLAGPALVGALLEAGLRNGVDVRVEAPVVHLLTDRTGLRGVVVHADGIDHDVRADEGSSWPPAVSRARRRRPPTYLDAPFGVQVSPKGHDGIAVQLAQEIGADLTGMQDAWWMPGVQLPGEELEGRPLSRVFLGERALPHSIMVNAKGERFANEALAYDQFGQIMREVDPETGAMPNAVAWLVFDHTYWRKFGIFGSPPAATCRTTCTRLTACRAGDQIGVDESGCAHRRAVQRECRQGRDTEFHRGDTLFDSYFGAFHPRLGSTRPTHCSRPRPPRAVALAAMIGPMVNKLAGRAARATTRSACVPSWSSRWPRSSGRC